MIKIQSILWADWVKVRGTRPWWKDDGVDCFQLFTKLLRMHLLICSRKEDSLGWTNHVPSSPITTTFTFYSFSLVFVVLHRALSWWRFLCVVSFCARKKHSLWSNLPWMGKFTNKDEIFCLIFFSYLVIILRKEEVLGSSVNAEIRCFLWYSPFADFFDDKKK